MTERQLANLDYDIFLDYLEDRGEDTEILRLAFQGVIGVDLSWGSKPRDSYGYGYGNGYGGNGGSGYGDGWIGPYGHGFGTHDTSTGQAKGGGPRYNTGSGNSYGYGE